MRRKARYIDLAQLASLINWSFNRVTGFFDGEAEERMAGLDRYRKSLLWWKWTAGDEEAEDMKSGCLRGDLRDMHIGDLRERRMGDSLGWPERPIGCRVTRRGELWEEWRL